MASSSGEVVIVPRNFVLLEELEKAEKGNTDMTVSYGLVMSDDISLSNWQCTILGPQNCPVENRIISLLVHCDEAYPAQCPKITFQTKLNFPFIKPSGELDPTKMPNGGTVKAWYGQMGRGTGRTIEGALKDIKAAFIKAEYKKLQQPPDGATY